MKLCLLATLCLCSFSGVFCLMFASERSYWEAQRKNEPCTLEVSVSGEITYFLGAFTITQRYKNRLNSNTDAKYLFNLNEGATVVGMSMTVGSNQKRISEIVEKTEARKTSASADSQTGSLLEKATNGIYSISIENIPANEEVVIEIDYITELKIASDGELAFIFPTEISRKHEGASQKTVKDLIAHQATNDAAFRSILPNSFYVNITWESSAKINRIYSLKDEIEVSSINQQKVNIQATIASNHGDFNLFAATETLGTLRYIDDDTGEVYIMLADRFQNNNTPVTPAVEKEFIIVLDISKSMFTETMAGWSGVIQTTPKLDLGKQAAEANKNVGLKKIAELSAHVVGKELFTCLFDILNENWMKTYLTGELSNQPDLMKREWTPRAAGPVKGSSKAVVLITDGDVTNSDSVISLSKSR
jgi:hypothetical protein